MELSKKDTTMTKGIAIVFMVVLHLFCRVDNLPYECIKLANGIPLVYYIGLFADQCVAIYCLCSGYAIRLICEKTINVKEYYKGRLKSILILLINYWTVLIVFTVLGLITNNQTIPGSVGNFIKHFLLLSKDYNGAWWYIVTYILLVLSSKFINKILDIVNPAIFNIVLLIMYFLAYYQRLSETITFDNAVLNWIIRQITLFFIYLLPFVWGMYFYKYKLFTKIRDFISKNNIPNVFIAIISVIIMILMIVMHGIIQNEMVQIFTAVVTVVLFNVVKKGKVLERILLFLGNHSTNIWLTHMFFYSVLFKDFIFIAKYSIAIFLFMMILTITSSYIINTMTKPIIKLVK